MAQPDTWVKIDYRYASTDPHDEGLRDVENPSSVPRDPCSLHADWQIFWHMDIGSIILDARILRISIRII